MPIRPEDFDTPSPRTAVHHKSAAVDESLITRHERAKKERAISSSVGPAKGLKAWIAGAISLLIICVVVAMVMFVSPQRLTQHITPQVAKDPLSEGGKNHKHSDDVGVVPPQPLPGSPGAQQIFPPPTPLPKTYANPPVRTKESLDHEKAEALKRNLARQQAELELEEKRLADQQAALEAQRREEAQQEARNREELDRQKELHRTGESPQLKGKEPVSVSSTPPPYHGPSSGTLVWEGEVTGAELVTIEDGAASSGKVVTGMLPGVPCLVQSSDPKRVSIAIAPSPSNQWKRIVLRIQGNGHARVKVTWALP